VVESEDKLPHFITQEELNDLVRDLSLSKEKTEILGSRLQEWNLLQEETKISHFRDRHSSLAAFYHTSIAGQFPHGNSKRGSNCVMTQPHVLRDVVSAGVPGYQKLVAAAGPTVQPSTATSAQRNTAQIKNTMRHQRITGRLTLDVSYNLHEFVYDTDFIATDLEVIMYNTSVMDIQAATSLRSVTACL